MASVTGCGPAPAARSSRPGGTRVVLSSRPDRYRPTVLPRPYRMRRSEDFRRTLRSGVRIGRPTLVLHATPAPGPDQVRVGFLVGKAVGNAVTRNRVRRRLRHLVAAEVARTPGAVHVVVRALPRAATAPTELPVDLASAWPQALARLGVRTPEPAGAP
jgi:ribonuclease P protein component